MIDRHDPDKSKTGIEETSLIGSCLNLDQQEMGKAELEAMLQDPTS